MDDLNEFGKAILLVSIGFTLALALRGVAERLSLPMPALLLIAAAVVSDVFADVGRAIGVDDVQRIATVALIVILLDGGMHIGWRRFRASAVPVLSLGVLGTFATSALVAVAAHELLDVSWELAGLLGAAVAPTDPAVTFSVLSGKEIRGRTGTILEGESGFNDPVGIALMIGLVELATSEGGSFWTVVEEFSLEMALGLVVGIAGALALRRLMQRVDLPSAALYPLRVFVFAGVVYGAAVLVHGSGFLAVFVAGILLGDTAAPYKGEIERFHNALANLAEIAAFVALGVTVDLGFITDEGLWWDGLLIAAVLGFVVRPLVVVPLLLPVRLQWGERLFVTWSGLKGAVPILLASLAVVAGTERADELYGIVFVVVLFSVVVQGSLVPWAAARTRVPMRRVEAHPQGVQALTVSGRAFASGNAVRDLPLGQRAWVSAVVRDGDVIDVHDDLRLEPGDIVHVLSNVHDQAAVRRIFEGAG